MSPVVTVRSIIHLVLILSIAAWGFLAWPLPFPGVLIGFGVLVLVVVLWALFLSPKPVLAVDRFGRSFIELLLTAGAVAALLAIGILWWIPILVGLVSVIVGFLAERQV